MIAGGMAIGSHTHSHPVLSQLDPQWQFEELSKSRAILKEKLGIEADALAYPVGGRNSFTDATQRAAQEAGYRVAFSFHGGVNLPGKSTLAMWLASASGGKAGRDSGFNPQCAGSRGDIGLEGFAIKPARYFRSVGRGGHPRQTTEVFFQERWRNERDSSPKRGLGNQLFQYAAGMFFARKYGASLAIIREPDEHAVAFGRPRLFLLSKYRLPRQSGSSQYGTV